MFVQTMRVTEQALQLDVLVNGQLQPTISHNRGMENETEAEKVLNTNDSDYNGMLEVELSDFRK